MNLLSVVTPPSIYHGCSTWKTFWRETFTPVNMNNCGPRNFRKHREIKNGNQYIAFDISLKFGDMDNMKITYSDPKYHLGRSGKVLITSLVIISIRRSKTLKRKILPLLKLVLRIFLRLLRNLRMCLMGVMWVIGTSTYVLTVIYFYQDSFQSVWWVICVSW